MTRIIAGSAGGRTLLTPPGSGTRPTSDRVREALFSALDSRDAVHGADVLDLYAGSGALGLEAASRGAASVVLVESDRRAAAVVRRNARVLGLADRASVVGAGVRVALARSPARAAGLVLLDPPYDLPEDELAGALEDLATRGWLASGAVLVVERPRRAPEPTWPAGTSSEAVRRYGETALWFATWLVPDVT